VPWADFTHLGILWASLAVSLFDGIPDKTWKLGLWIISGWDQRADKSHAQMSLPLDDALPSPSRGWATLQQKTGTTAVQHIS
jgi:hypothetical protein